MIINDIVDAWELNKLPTDINTLIAWKKEADQAEQIAFDAWRDSTAKTKEESQQLVFNHVLYHEISMGIQSHLTDLLTTRPFKRHQ